MRFQSCLYLGTVVHQRLRPRRHELSYRVFSVLFDLDELPALAANLRLFSLGRWGVFSFREEDHGDGTGALRSWVLGQLADAGIDLDGGAVRILCYPRFFGYAFNPLSVFFCYRSGGDLAAILYEVRNTFGERHGYLVPVEHPGEHAGGNSARVIRQACDKQLYVSPFIAMQARYHFRIVPPGETISVVINQSDEEGPLLRAWFKGWRAPISDRMLATMLFRYPLMTLKVIGGIHWEALRLWLKGVPLVDRPLPPTYPVTVVPPRS